jgi:hypothetical protein
MKKKKLNTFSKYLTAGENFALNHFKEPPSKSPRSKPILAQRCSEVTLDEFIDCLVNGNLRRLARSGSPTDEELQAAWEKVYGEYVELSGNHSYSYYFSLVKSISVLQTKLQLANMLLRHGAIETLKELGYSGDAKKIIAKMKREIIELQAKQKELERFKEESKNETMKESDFIAWIIHVSKYLGYHIDRKTVTVSEFMAANKIMNEEIDIKLKNSKKHGRTN